jgi:putative endonuclease
VELDAVALDGRTLCFVEVKTASEGSPVEPEWHVTPAKRRALLRAARLYLRAHRLEEADVESRFDIVAVRLSDGGADIRVYRDALRD